MDLRPNCSASGLSQFCWSLNNAWWFIPFKLSISPLKLKGTRLGYWWLSLCISVCLTPCNPQTFINSLKWLQITFLVLYQVSSRLVSLLQSKHIYIHVSNIFFLLSVSSSSSSSYSYQCHTTNFSFQIFCFWNAYHFHDWRCSDHLG